MSRPLLICDCDEVILHMVAHFRDWLHEERAVSFDLQQPDWGQALTHHDDGRLVEEADIWSLLESFFREEMRRQTLVPGARDALETLSEHGDIVILTNIGEDFAEPRVAQLASHGMQFEVVGNRGGKGAPVNRLLGRFEPSHAVFVDDLATQHRSVAKHAPSVKRLHLVAEPEIAPIIPPASDAHARIDDWGEATAWILQQWERAA